MFWRKNKKTDKSDDDIKNGIEIEPKKEDKEFEMIDFTKGTCDFCIAWNCNSSHKWKPTKYTLSVNGKNLEFCEEHLVEFHKRLTESLLCKGLIPNDDIADCNEKISMEN